MRFLADAAQVEVSCLLAQLPQFITTIVGIGSVTGAALLAEIGDVSRFASVEKLVGYVGIDATAC